MKPAATSICTGNCIIFTRIIVLYKENYGMWYELVITYQTNIL